MSYSFSKYLAHTPCDFRRIDHSKLCKKFNLYTFQKPKNSSPDFYLPKACKNFWKSQIRCSKRKHQPLAHICVYILNQICKLFELFCIFRSDTSKKRSQTITFLLIKPGYMWFGNFSFLSIISQPITDQTYQKSQKWNNILIPKALSTWFPLLMPQGDPNVFGSVCLAWPKHSNHPKTLRCPCWSVLVFAKWQKNQIIQCDIVPFSYSADSHLARLRHCLHKCQILQKSVWCIRQEVLQELLGPHWGATWHSCWGSGSLSVWQCHHFSSYWSLQPPVSMHLSQPELKSDFCCWRTGLQRFTFPQDPWIKIQQNYTCSIWHVHWTQQSAMAWLAKQPSGSISCWSTNLQYLEIPWVFALGKQQNFSSSAWSVHRTE